VVERSEKRRRSSLWVRDSVSDLVQDHVDVHIQLVPDGRGKKVPASVRAGAGPFDQ